MNIATFKPFGINNQFVERYVLRNYYLAKLYYTLLILFTDLRERDPIIVFQMGKVGSTSIVTSLESLNLGRPIFHVHALVEAHRKHSEVRINLSPRQYFKRSKNALISQYLEKEIHRSRKRKASQLKKKWKVITLVRDPVAQNISSFFQIVDLYVENVYERYHNKQLEIKELTSLFLEQYSPDCIFNNWFDLELRPVFGIDVYASTFPKTKGYEIYHGEIADVLLLKLENLNQCVSEAFYHFLGLEKFTLINKNIAQNKKYSSAYKEFKNTVSLPNSYIDAIYALKQVQHFYTQEEIEGFRTKLKIQTSRIN